jgi:hypothetical protein
VAEDIRAVSWSVVAAIAGIVAVVATIVYGEIQRRLARRQLLLAQEQAELCPQLAISLREMVYHHRPENPGSRYEQASIVFDVANDGRSAAHNVRCKVRLDERHLVPDDTHGVNRDFSAAHIGPSSDVPLQINVAVLSYGPTEACYHCVCDEVGKSEGRVEFEVPKRKPPDL